MAEPLAFHCKQSVDNFLGLRERIFLTLLLFFLQGLVIFAVTVQLSPQLLT